MQEKTEGAIKNRQSINTGSIGQSRIDNPLTQATLGNQE